MSVKDISKTKSNKTDTTAAGAEPEAEAGEEKTTFNQFAYQNQYNREKYDRVNLTMPKGQKEVVRQQAKKRGQSVNEYINAIIMADIAAGQEETDGK